MTDGNRLQKDQKLRSLLQEGDPAADGLAPDVTELHRWRRQTLNAARVEPSSPGWRRPLVPLATLAGAAVVASLFLFLPLGENRMTPLDQPTQEPRIADGGLLPQSPALPLAQAQPQANQNSSVPPEPAPPARITPQSTPESGPLEAGNRPTASSAPSTLTPPPAAPATDVVLATARTVHFTAPGGTRVIWTLNPELELPTEGGSS
jgi:hypothetical protein